MYHPRTPSTPGNRSANSTSNFKRSLLLPLLIVMALVGVVFSGASRSVHSSDATVAGNSAGMSGAATKASEAGNPAGVVRDAANQASVTSPASTREGAAGDEQAASGGEQVSLNHGRVAQKFFPSIAPVAAIITATKTDALVNDDGDGKIDPTNGNPVTEERITYTVTITNTGPDPATKLKFIDTIDTHTTLVPGSLNTSPIASVDTYSASGNIPLSLAVAGGVLANDIDPDNGSNSGLNVTEVQGVAGNVGVATDTTATGRGGVKGSVTVSANGSFTYEPPPGFEGADTFTYKISDGTSTDTATVTINISGMVWFIQNNAGGSNRGTFSNPFTTIASFNTANVSGVAPDPKNGDFISLRTGTGTYSESDGINLRNTQKLIGNGVQFSSVFTAAANSSSAYTTFAGAAAGAPTIVTSAGNGVDLADSNTVRGLNVGNTSAFKINGGAVGSPIINTINLTGTGGAINVSTSGAFGANVTFATLESSSSAASNINLVGVTGTLGVTSGGTGLSGSTTNAIIINGGSVSLSYPGNVTKITAGSLLSVLGGHTGTLTFTATLSANTAGDGLQFNNADGTYNFNGTTTLNLADAGIDIANNSSGTFSFNANTSITNPTNEAITIAGGTQTFTYSGSFSKTNGSRGILVQNNTAGTILFNGSGVTKTITTTGANNAIDLLTNTNTTINFTNNNLLLTANGSGVGFNATGGGTITVQGTGNTITSNTGTALNVTSTNIGLSGLTFLSITAGTAASGPTNGIVLNATGTTAGTHGGLTVTGTSTTAGSGGTIQRTVQGALFTSTINLSLSNMDFTNANSGNGVCNNIDGPTFNSSCQAAINLSSVTTVTFTNLALTNPAGAGAQIGINGQTVSGLTMSNTTISTFGNAVNENDMRFFNLTGTCSITNSTFTFASENVVDIRNNTGTLNLTVQGNPLGTSFNTFSDTQTSATGAAGLSVTAVSSATVNMTVKSSKFLKLKTVGIQTFARDNSTMNVDIVGGGVNANGNQFDPMGGIGRAVDLNAEDTADLNFNINNNLKMYGNGGPTVNIFSINTAVVQGRINNNPDVRAGGDTASGSGINVHPEDDSTGVVEILNNVISGIGNDPGIFAFSHGDGPSPALDIATLDVTIQGNSVTIANSGGAGSVPGIDTRAGSNAGDKIKTCVDVMNNVVALGPPAAGNIGWLAREGSATAGNNLYLEGMVAGATNQLRTVNTWNGRGNTPAGSAVSVDAAGAAAYTAPPAGAPYFGVCRTPSNPSAMLNLESDPNSALARSGDAYSSLGSTMASLVADYVPASEAVNVAQSEDEFRTATTANARDLSTQTQVAATTSASLTAIATAADELPATTLNTAQTKASVNKRRDAMQLSHAIRTRTRTRALAAAAMLAGETITIDGGAGVSPANSGFTLPAGKSITVTFQVTLNNPPNLTTPIPVGGPIVSNQGNVTADGGINVLTDDPAVGGGSDPTTTPVDLFNSQTSVTTSNASSSQGESVTFTATVSLLAAGSPAGTPGTPTGTVDFFDGAAIPANAIAGCSGMPVNGLGVATCTTSAITPAGSPHTITARYNGDGNFDPSSGTVAQTVIACISNPVVTSTADSGANTLRDALANVCNAPNNNITFNLGAGPQTITALSTLVIAKNVNITNTITGTNGALTITANGGNFRVFQVDSPVTSASLNGFTVTGASPNNVGNGGGLLVQSGTVTLTGMLFTGNTVINSAGGGLAVTGGATLNVRNSTISGNTATSGGGIYNNASTLNLLNVTVTNNTADGNVGGGPIGGAGAFGGGIDTATGTATNIKNSIVAGNFATSDTNVSGTITDQGNNILTGDPRIAALANNGGTTRTHALLNDSTALDAGDNTAADAIPLNTDQRGAGFGRKLDAADANTTQTVDIGAFEADPSVENITDKSTNEETLLSFVFNVGDAATAFDSITATSGAGDQALVPNANITVGADTPSTRLLSITPAANQSGTATITVTVTKTISGTPVSMSDTFVLTVNEINDPPSFTLPGNPAASDEDAGAQTVNPYATSISEGPNETGQTPLTFTVSPTGSTGSLTFSSAPAIDPTTGILTYTASPDTNGTASFSVTLSDSGSNVAPNSNTSAAQNFTITVNPINDPPSFTLAGNPPGLNENAGAQTVNGFASAISQGPNETGQTLTFNVSPTGSTGTLTFSTPPAIDATTGNLTYTPTNGTNGTATFDVTLSDNGSNVAPNSNTSAAQSFTISVNGVNDPPVNTVPAAVSIPQDTVLTFAGVNLISVADPDAAAGVIAVSLTATNGTLTLSTTNSLTFSAGDGTNDASMAFTGTLTDINAALNGMTFTPTTGYTGAATVQIVTNDQGNTGTGSAQSDTDTVNITVTAPTAMYINEVLFNPDASGTNEYIELRGTPSSTVPAGTYFVAVDGDAGNIGDVTTYINISGLSFGTNGFLVLLQNGNTYTTTAGATVVTSSGPSPLDAGFGGLPGGIFQADGGAKSLEDDSVTFMLIQTGVAPNLSDDIDSDNDGTPDGAVHAGWSIRDSIGVLDGTDTGDRTYGAFNYSNNTGTNGSATGTTVLVGFNVVYVGRRGDTTGSAAADWVASCGPGGTAPNFTLDPSSTEVEPSTFAGKTLDHIGSTNFLNKVPVNTVPGAQATNEDIPITFNAANTNLISITDSDAGTQDVKVTLTAVNGTFSLSGTANLTFTTGDGVNDALMVFTGKVSDINTALDGLTFTPTLNYSGAASLTILTDDQGNTGVDGAKTDTDLINITVNAINDPPSFVAGVDQTVNEDAGAQTVTGWATAISQGAGDPAQALTFNVSVGGTTGNIAFSSGPAIDPATGTLTYTTSPNTNGSATINVTLSDNGSNVAPNSNTSGVQSFTITVNAVNDAPSFQILSNPPSVNEDASAQTVNSFATNFLPGPAAATDEAGQTLVGYTITQTGTTGNLTFTSGPSIDTAGALTYTPTGNTSGTATFNVVATDSGSGSAPNVNQSAAVAFTITVNGQNDAPVLDNTGNMSLNIISEDVPNASNNGTLVSDIIASAGGNRITDVDAGSIEGIAVISVDNTNGVWQFSIDNGANWTAFGTPNAPNARLLASDATTRVRFIPNANFNGTVNPGLTFRAWDQASGSNGNTADTSLAVGGTTPFSTATETASITVTEVNDAPTANNDAIAGVAEDSGPNTIPFTNLTVNDSKGPANENAQTLTVTNVSNPVGGTVSIVGTDVIFTPTAGYNGPASFQYTVTDNGTTNGVAAPLQSAAPATVTFTVNAVNDAPVNTVPGAQTVLRNTALTLSGANLIAIADVDAGAAAVQVTLSATNGTISLSATAGLVFTTGDGTGDATMTFTGTLASINAALSGLVFTPTTDYTGAASIQITTNDLGNTGAGGPLSDTDTISITVLERMLQFASANFAVSEADCHATITVTRVGGTSQAASVDYTTSDLSGLTNCNITTGNASQRCDYTAIAGTLSFPAGQSVAAFEIPIINDVYVEGPETLSLTLSNPQGGIMGTPTTATLTITDNDLVAGAPNPIDDPAFFVALQYMDTLNREPEAQGLADWLAIIQNCPAGDTSCDLVEVSSGFFRSPEFFQRAYYIYRFYEVGLGRKPSYDEYQRDLRLVTGFLTNAELEQRKQQFALDFSQRAEFKALYDQYDSATRSQAYVDALSQMAGVTLGNRQQLASELVNSIRQRWDVLRAIVEGPEVSAKFFNKAFVVIGYFAYLRRDPDALYLVWLAQMDNPPAGKTQREVYRDMIAGFIFSPEYRHRFGP